MLSPRSAILKQRYATLKANRSSMDTYWQTLSDYVMPRKSEITSSKPTDPSDFVEDLYDMTATQANMKLAAGIVAQTTPATERWFEFGAPERILDDPARRGKARQWFQEATTITLKALARSNFYSEIHEAHLDRNAMGTCALYVTAGRKTLLNFRSLRIGGYVIMVDDEGNVDGVIRELKLDARQCALAYGEETLGPQFKKELQGDGKQTLTKHTIIQAILPRDDADRLPGASTGKNKPVASITIDCDEDVELEETGFDEMPVAVSRYLQWGDREWGLGPGLMSLPIVRQLNFLEQKQDALAELAIDPRILVPSNLIDEIDFRAGGVTAFDENNQAMPKEWMTEARYEVAQDRIERKQKFIRDLFHNDLFEMFSNLERQITAAETYARLEEKLNNFSPTHGRITGELLDPILTRSFSILFRAGAFPNPPAEVFIATVAGMALPIPEVVFTSKIALALKAKENGSLRDALMTIFPLMEAGAADLLDNFDTDQITVDVSHNFALPPRWIRDAEAVAAIRKGRQEAAAAQEQAALLQSGAKAAKDLGGAPPAMQKQLVG